MIEWDHELSPEQRAAASYRSGHACLLAGPGTGKTRCLTRRIVYLLSEGVSASQIQAITFTRMAAAELRSRVEDHLGKGNPLPLVSTLHSFALSTILQRGEGTRLPQPIRIADDWEERFIVQEELKWLLNLDKIDDAQDLLNRLSADWETLSAEQDGWEGRFPNPAFLGAWRQHRDVYRYTLRAELVYQLKVALEEGALHLQNPPTELLVDEYQDLNACDLAVVAQIVSTGCRLFAAGDDDQSIYGFRFAEPAGIRAFTTTFRGSKNILLEECRRCRKAILDYALYVARQDPQRLSKNIRSVRPAGDCTVALLSFPTGTDEANGVAKLCRWLIDSQKVPAERIIILLRSDRYRAFSDPIRDALSVQHLDAGVASDPMAPLESDSGRRFLCLLRLLANPKDHLAWRAMLHLPGTGVGAKTLHTLFELARDRGLPYAAVLDMVRLDPRLAGSRGAAVARTMQQAEVVLDRARSIPSDSMLTFLREFARQEIPDPDQMNAVQLLLQKVVTETNADTLEKVLRALGASLGSSEQERNPHHVTIMTMHQAKGLEADAVIVMAAEKEYLPGPRRGKAVDDERRLLYVSLSRARDYLFVTYANMRTGFQTHTGSTPGILTRHLTEFLSGGPLKPQSGESYVEALRPVVRAP